MSVVAVVAVLGVTILTTVSLCAFTLAASMQRRIQ